MESVVFSCQMCKSRLALTGVEQLSPSGLLAVGLEQEGHRHPKAEDSFVVLESRKKEQQPEKSGGHSVEESFVVLGPLSSTPQRDNLDREEDECERLTLAGASDLDEKLKALARIFELASEDSGTDHPLCVDCASQVRAQMETEKRRLEGEIADYSEAVKRLEAEEDGLYLLSDAEFDKKMAEAEAEFERERAQVEALESQVVQAEMKMNQLQSVSEQLDDLEAAYWHYFNDYSLKIQDHLDEKAAIVNRINLASEKLGWLQQTTVCLDAFKIDHSGPFGTISGFRMGRTSEVHVDWDEINAGWGQAVLLLYTMANLCKFNFSVYRLVPMGSKPKILEKRGAERRIHELYGPVSKVWSFHYDRAMIAFLTCLKEFADFAHSEDLKEGLEDAFNLPFAIESDKIDGRTIKLSLNKDARWTKALKFMLADLLACMQWLGQQKSLP